MYIFGVILPLVITDAFLIRSIYDAELRNQDYYREKAIDCYSNFFENLLKNLSIWRFQCLGCFIYSPEENTLGYKMHPRVRSDVSRRRYEKVMELQQLISLSYNEARVGKTYKVTIDSTSQDGIFYLGRSYGEAPEVDPLIYVASTNRPLECGDTVSVKILECTPYDLTGVTEDESAK